MKSWVRLAAIALLGLTAPIAAHAEHGERQWGGQEQHREAPRGRQDYAPRGERGPERGQERGQERGSYYAPPYGGRGQPAYRPERPQYYAPGGGYPVYPGYRPPAYRPPSYGGRPYGAPGYAAPRYAPPAAGYGRWRRGQILPPAYRGAVVSDFGRYHLRRPPRGYYWVHEGEDFVLVASGTGLIFDVISGGY